MKYFINIQKILLVALLFIGVGSCTKDFEELNQDPNNPVDVPAINIFTNAVQGSIDRQLGGWIQHTYLGPWSQQWCKVQYVDEDKYMPRDMSGDFDGPYSGELKNLQIVITKTSKTGGDAKTSGSCKNSQGMDFHAPDRYVWRYSLFPGVTRFR